MVQELWLSAWFSRTGIVSLYFQIMIIVGFFFFFQKIQFLELYNYVLAVCLAYNTFRLI